MTRIYKSPEALSATIDERVCEVCVCLWLVVTFVTMAAVSEVFQKYFAKWLQNAKWLQRIMVYIVYNRIIMKLVYIWKVTTVTNCVGSVFISYSTPLKLQHTQAIEWMKRDTVNGVCVTVRKGRVFPLISPQENTGVFLGVNQSCFP